MSNNTKTKSGNSAIIGSIFGSLIHSFIMPFLGAIFFIVPYYLLTLVSDLDIFSWINGSYTSNKNIIGFPYLEFFLSTYIFLLASTYFLIKKFETRFLDIAKDKKVSYNFEISDKGELIRKLFITTISAYILSFIAWRIVSSIIDFISFYVLGNKIYKNISEHLSFIGIYDEFLLEGVFAVGWDYLFLFHYLQYFFIFYIYHKKCFKLFGYNTFFYKDPISIK